jgi:hypothetical protein
MVEAAQQSLTPTPAPSEMASPVPGPTAIPVEWQTNFNQTNGVVVGGVILVLIIIGGAIAVLAKPKGDNQPEKHHKPCLWQGFFCGGLLATKRSEIRRIGYRRIRYEPS